VPQQKGSHFLACHLREPARTVPPRGRSLRAAAVAFCAFLLVAGAVKPCKDELSLARVQGALARVKETHADLPLSFEANQGQADPRVKFLSRGRGYTLFLTADEAVLPLRSQKPEVRSQKEEKRPWSLQGGITGVARGNQGTTDVLRLKLVGANRGVNLTALDELPGKSNYFIGNDPRKWRTDVPTYAKVKYEGVYPGIDLIYYSNQQQLEYDFVVAPGADPSAIALHVETGNWELETGNSKLETRNSKTGALRVDANGDLVIATNRGEVRLHKPVVYQLTETGQLSCLRRVSSQVQETKDNGPRTADVNRQFVDGRYVLLADNRIGFEVASYDRSRPLVIDPVLTYATYLGGTGFDSGRGIAVDSMGNAYVTGYTDSLDFPLVDSFQRAPGGGTCGTDLDVYPCFDVFVAKLNAAGTALVYSTYLGGSGEDYGLKVVVTPSGNAFVTGYTNSTDFPTSSPLQAANRGGYDAFVAELDPTGSALVYSTYLGGSGDDYGFGLAVDSSGNAHIAGFTASSDFPTTSGSFQARYGGGLYDAFAVKLNAQGSSLVYSTYLGGSTDDFAYGIVVDSAANAYVVGSTNSLDFPTAAALQPAPGGGTCGNASSTIPCFDAFITKLNPEGSAPVYSTYLGGRGGDYGYAIAVDTSGNTYVTGYTASPNFPTTLGAFQAVGGGSSHDAFVAKLNAAGSAFIFSTFLGGIRPAIGYDIAADSSGNSYVTGYAYGAGFPTADPIQAENAGFDDVFVTKVNPSGTGLVFSTYLGGSGNEEGRGIALDPAGNAYVTGVTFSTDFPVSAGGFQTGYAGGSFDAFIAKLALVDLPFLALSTESLTFPNQPIGMTSAPQAVALTNLGAATLTVSSIAASGDYAVTSDCGSSLAPGAACTLGVTFVPTTMGEKAGALTINDSDDDSPHVVSLSGRGVAAYSLAAAGDPVHIIKGTDAADVSISAASACGFSQAISLGCSGGTPTVCAFDPNAIKPGQASQLRVSNLSALPGDSYTFVVNGTSGAQQASLSLVVLMADFGISAAPSQAAVLAGQSAAYTLTVSPVNGFNQAVELSCSGVPPMSTCALQPSTLTLNGDSSAKATLTVTTTARATSLPRPRPPAPLYLPQLPAGWAKVWWLLLLSAFVAVWGRWSAQRPRRALLSPAGAGGRAAGAFVAKLAFVLLWCSCGGGSGGSIPQPAQPTGTPAGSYGITITGKLASPSGGNTVALTHTTTVTLSIN